MYSYYELHNRIECDLDRKEFPRVRKDINSLSSILNSESERFELD